MNDVLALQMLPTDEGKSEGVADDNQEDQLYPHYPHSHASAHCGFSGLSLLAC